MTGHRCIRKKNDKKQDSVLKAVNPTKEDIPLEDKSEKAMLGPIETKLCKSYHIMQCIDGGEIKDFQYPNTFVPLPSQVFRKVNFSK